MSFLNTQPEVLASAAGDLTSIGAVVQAGSAAAAAPTTGVVPPAADEVSTLTTTQFAAHALLYQQLSAQAAEIHQRFVDVLGISAASYAATEVANAATVQ